MQHSNHVPLPHSPRTEAVGSVRGQEEAPVNARRQRTALAETAVPPRRRVGRPRGEDGVRGRVCGGDLAGVRPGVVKEHGVLVIWVGSPILVAAARVGPQADAAGRVEDAVEDGAEIGVRL